MEIDESITLSSYDPVWAVCYATEKHAILFALTAGISGIEHIGSTAIPGLVGKPVIDILIGIPRLPMSVGQINKLRTLGYEHLGEAGVPGRIYFRKRQDRAFNIAVVEWNGRLWNDNLLLRDFLLTHPDHAGRYGEVKQRTLSAGVTHLLEYSAKKNGIITEMLEEARQWQKTRPGRRSQVSPPF